MSSQTWSRNDIRNILLAIYAVKSPTLVDSAAEKPAEPTGEDLYRWGCRVAIQSLMLAFGLPLKLLDESVEGALPALKPGGAITEHWSIDDMENIISAVYRSALSAPILGTTPSNVQHYRQGFAETIEAFLQATGSRKNPQRWLEQMLRDRDWVYLPD
jgi:hypothetical protein